MGKGWGWVGLVVKLKYKKRYCTVENICLFTYARLLRLGAIPLFDPVCLRCAQPHMFDHGLGVKKRLLLSLL